VMWKNELKKEIKSTALKDRERFACVDGEPPDDDDSDKEDDDFPKNSIFSLELEDPMTPPKPIERSTRKKGITVITKKSHSMEKSSGTSVIKPPGFPDKSNLPAKETHRQRKKNPLETFPLPQNRIFRNVISSQIRETQN